MFFYSPIDIRRHISCEVCDYSVSGGYDPELNQVTLPICYFLPSQVLEKQKIYKLTLFTCTKKILHYVVYSTISFVPQNKQAAYSYKK